MRRALRGVAVAAAMAALAVAPAAMAATDGGADAGLTYAVIGDTPYGVPQVANFANDVAEINADRGVRLVMHLGDIKNGSSRCDTSYFQQIRAAFDGFRAPLVYTPGDNEWTDCHRGNNGGYTPTERLDVLRSLFFPVPGRTLGGNMPVDAQDAPYVENVSWSRADVVFATLDVPGSNNDWAPWFGAATRTPAQVAEYTGRNAADLEWLDRTFDRAEQTHAKAVVIGIQADMWDPEFSTPPTANPASFDRYTEFVQALATRARAFGRPVLLLNGDSHAFTDDRPLADAARPYQRTMYGVSEEVPNLRRITVNGSTTACHEWLKLRVDPGSPGVFSVARQRFANQPGFDPAVCPVG